MKFLTEQKIRCLKQFGFRKIFSTAHAIINLIDSIEIAFDKNKFTCRVFIDLNKAFDTVDWLSGLNPISQTECNMSQFMESCMT